MSNFKPPTRHELQEAKATEQLYGSNILKLQISELLTEVSCKPHPSELDQLLNTVRDTIKNSSCSDRVKLNEGLTLLPNGDNYPLTFMPTSDTKGYFQFFPPKEVHVIGSFLLNTQLKSSQHVDLNVCMPEECLQPKDMLNYRYFHKRALYLAIIAQICKDIGIFKSINYRSEHPLLPVLELIPKKRILKNYVIVIHIAIPDGYFPSHKLYPNRNNVRTCEGIPTPNYNANLLTEMNCRRHHLEMLYTAIDECPGIREAIILYKIWNEQRQFNKKLGCFSSFLFSMLLLYLLRKSKISNKMSCYQIFIVAMKFIVDSDLTTKGISIVDRTEYPTLPPVGMYHEHYGVVFIDDSVTNMCSNMSVLQYKYLKSEAQLSLMLSFESLYLRSVPMLLKFDGLIRINLCDFDIKLLFPNDHQTIESDNRGWTIHCTVGKLLCIIEQALGNRVVMIGQDGYHHNIWNINDRPKTCDYITIGLIYNKDSVNDQMTIGPVADDEQAKKFRSFWGDISELRRFNDNNIICEAVPWNDTVNILHQILIHSLQRHANICDDRITTTMNCDLEYITKLFSFSDNMQKSLSQLRKILRSIDGLPLAISTVKCVTPITTLAYCENDKYTGICDVCVQLEESGKWPTNVKATQNMITLYYIELSRLLAKRKIVSVPTEDSIDIKMNDQYVFKLHVTNPHKLKGNDESYLSSYLASKQAEWPAFSASAKLCKRWIASHLLSNHFKDEVIDIILVSLFLNPDPLQISNSPIVVFFRFLSLLMSHDWSHDPLIVNIDNNLSDTSISDIKQKYIDNRSIFPSMGVFSCFDSMSENTLNKPIYPVLCRVVLLAKTSLTFIMDNIFDKSINLKQVFRSPLDDYNVIIYLRLTNKLTEASNRFRPVFNPVDQYLSILEDNFSDYAVFFYDKYGGGNIICVLWKPQVYQSFTHKTQYNYCMIEDKGKYKINTQTLTEDMIILGCGLVDKIENKS